MSIFVDSLWSVLLIGKKTSDPGESNSPRERARHLTANPNARSAGFANGSNGSPLFAFCDRDLDPKAKLSPLQK
jgi:hypothetical protein